MSSYREMVRYVEVIEGVKTVLRDSLELGDRVESFDMSTPLFESLVEFDSMAVVNVVMGLEEYFSISIDDDEVDGETFATVGDLSRFVEGKLSD